MSSPAISDTPSATHRRLLAWAFLLALDIAGTVLSGSLAYEGWSILAGQSSASQLLSPSLLTSLDRSKPPTPERAILLSLALSGSIVSPVFVLALFRLRRGSSPQAFPAIGALLGALTGAVVVVLVCLFFIPMRSRFPGDFRSAQDLLVISVAFTSVAGPLFVVASSPVIMVTGSILGLLNTRVVRWAMQVHGYPPLAQ